MTPSVCRLTSTRSNVVVVKRTWTSTSSPGSGASTSAGQEDHAHLHVRRLDEPALLAADDERRQRPAGRLQPPLATETARCRVLAAAAGASSAMPWAVPPDTHEHVPVLGDLALPVADPVAAARPGARRARSTAAPSAPRSPSHSSVPIRGRNSTSGCRAAQLGELGGGQVADEAAAWPATAAEPALDLGDVAVAQRQVQREPLDADAARRRRRARASSRAKPCRCIEVSASSTTRVRARRAPSASRSSSSADGVDQPRGVEHVGVEERPPRLEHEHVAAEALRDLGHLGVGADGEHVDAEPLGSAGQPTDREAVAVALGDRHEAGVGVGDRAQMVAPARVRRRTGSVASAAYRRLM